MGVGLGKWEKGVVDRVERLGGEMAGPAIAGDVSGSREEHRRAHSALLSQA